MTEPLRILIVAGHPADAFDNAGGTLCHHAARGDQVTALVLTQGARVHDEVLSGQMLSAERVPDAEELARLIQERAEVKRQEVRQACAILDIREVRFLEYDDAVLTVSEPIILAVARVIREVRPHVVITSWPGESGGYANQHATTAQIALNAIGAAGGVAPGDSNPPHHVAQVFFMAIPACAARTTVFDSQGGYYADVIVDVSDVVDRKLQALNCMRSQAYDGPYARKCIEVAEALFGFFAPGGQAAYAEAFIRRNAETHGYLPVTERALEWANLTERERFDRYCWLVDDESRATHDP